MLRFQPGQALREVLCVGAHSDDIEIGCGGTILRLIDEHPGLHVTWVVLSADGARADEATASAKSWLAEGATCEIVVEAFPDRYFPWHGAEIKTWLTELSRRCSPDLVLTHSRDDLHQDHRTVAELTWGAFRDHLILEYEIPKWDGDLGRPNLYVPLDGGTADRKVSGVLEGFPSQLGRDWFTPDTFYALMRLRGVESRALSGFAEAFTARKAVL